MDKEKLIKILFTTGTFGMFIMMLVVVLFALVGFSFNERIIIKSAMIGFSISVIFLLSAFFIDLFLDEASKN